MKRYLRFSIVIMIILLTFSIFTHYNRAFASSYDDKPEIPAIEWDDNYSKGATSQKVTMTAYVPKGTTKVTFCLIANDEVMTREKTLTKYDTEDVSQSFYSLNEEQEVWGYIIIYDGDDASERSDLASAYIGKKSSDTKKIDTPEEPEIEWEDTNSTSNNQRITMTAQIANKAEEIRFFLICNGGIKKSGSVKKETYTFRYIDYDQIVIGYVKAYDKYGNESHQSPTVMLSVGDDGEAIVPDKPNIYWIDQGFNYPYGQKVVINSTMPFRARKLQYYLLANGTLLMSEPTTETSYTFYNIYDNQTVTGFVRAYDRWDNASRESEKVQLYIPVRSYAVQQPDTSSGRDDAGDSTKYKDRIVDAKREITLKNFDLPPLWINASFNFADVPEKNNELRMILQYFYSTRLIDNAFTERFYPEEYITRMEFLEMLFNAANIKDKEASGFISHFKDIDIDYTYHDAVLTASYKNIMRGYSDHTFRPNNPLTGGVAARAIINAFEMRRHSLEGESLIDDIEEHCMDYLKDVGIMNKNISGIFDFVTREEAVKMVYKVIQIKMKN